MGGAGGETQPPPQPEGGLEGEVDEDENGGGVPRAPPPVLGLSWRGGPQPLCQPGGRGLEATSPHFLAG